MTSLRISIDHYLELPDSERVTHISALTENAVSSEDFLLEALPVESNSLVKWHIIKALGLCKSIQGIQSILQVCKVPDVDFGNTSLHAICAWSLGQIRGPSFDAVVSLFGTNDLATRRFVVDALGEIKDPRGIETLCFALEHDEYVVKLAAGLSLSKIGDEAVPAIEQILNRAEPVTRIIALDAIAKVNSVRSLSILESVLKEGSVEDKKLILRSSKKLDEALTSYIQALADGGDSELSTLARNALESANRPIN